MEVSRLRRVSAVPCVAQAEVSTGLASSFGRCNGSIIWPSCPSANTIAGVRYSKAFSKANIVRSHISCTLPGANTMQR